MIVKKPSPLERAVEFSYPPREWEEYRTALWYHEQSKFGKRKSEKDFVHIGQIRQNPSLVATMTKHFKIYPDVEYISLPSVVDLLSSEGMSLEEAIIRRRSVRTFSKQSMPFDVLARLLVFSYGITGEMPYDTGDVQYLRASPSAGALYPLEVYPVVFRVEGLEPGLYHYAVRKNAIGLLKKGDFSEFLVSLWTEQQMVREACVMFFLTAYPLRTLRKYRCPFSHILSLIFHLVCPFFVFLEKNRCSCTGFQKHIFQIFNLNLILQDIHYILLQLF
ncbi:MAG: SagB/ThcOx family dehydrogenase [Brevinematales bacterium]|nr:SagB/ThcOx family dehydrogenase [Brevinematales bacterium]